MAFGPGDLTMEEKALDISIDPNADLIWSTVGEYELFMAHKQAGIDAYLVRNHFIYTARRQHTNRVRATTTYIKNGTQLSEKRIKAAKAFLAEHGFISYHREIPKEGAPHLGKVYVEIRFPPLSTGAYEDQLSTGAHKDHLSTGPGTTPVETTPVETTPVETTPVESGPRNPLEEKEREEECSREDPATSPQNSDTRQSTGGGIGSTPGTKPEPPTAASPPLAEHIEIAEIIANHAEFLDAKVFFRKDKEKTVLKWADEIRKLETLDGRTIAEIKAVIEWFRQDSFWYKNIRSGGKLREKFSTLLIQMNGKKPTLSTSDEYRREAEKTDELIASGAFR